jgi:hypothetical protein
MALYSFLQAFGLSTATGLNAYIPLLVVGIMARLDWIQLQEPYSVIAHPLVLIVLAVLAILDFVGDKIPAVDHMLHAAGMVITPVAGALVFIAANSSVGELSPLLAGIAGLIVAGTTHTVRASVRPVATTATAGTANPVLSFLEDVVSFILAVLAVLLPIIATLLIIGLAVLLFVVLRRTMGIWKRARSG